MKAIRTALAAASALALAACGDGNRNIENQPIEPTVEPAPPGAETSPMTPADTPVYYGVWAADPELCALAPGAADPSPIAFSEGEFVAYGRRCRIAEAAEGTEGGYQLDILCRGGGPETAETVEVDVDGNMLRLRGEDGAETAYSRCAKDDRK